MHILVIYKGAFSSEEIRGVTNIAYNTSTQVYTVTRANGTTSTFDAANFYLQFLWGD